MQNTLSRHKTAVLLSQYDSENGRKAIITALSTSNTEVGYIASQPDGDRAYFKQTQKFYQSLGHKMSTFVELESGFNPSAMKKLLELDAIHLSGGDTFRFLEFIKEKNLDKLLVEYYKNGGILIGISAGAMVLTTSISTALLCGDTNKRELIDLSGLSITDFTIIPHVDDKFSMIEKGIVPNNCFLMSDNDVLVVENEQLKVLGSPVRV